MRHAIMIIAHKNVNQLIRLVHSLDDESFDVYIHLDKKWDISNKEIQMIRNAGKNVYVIEKRISGFLDTWSLCDITLELIYNATRHHSYSYYLLLSGQDYPIKSISYIKEVLSSLYPKPLIDCTPMVKDNWIYSGFKWIRFHAYYRFVWRITKNRIGRKLLLLPIYAIQLFVTVIVGSPLKRLRSIGCELYGGSAWWILPEDIIKLCLDEYKKNSKLIQAFKIKNTPEETFFQTMAMRSPLKDLVSLNNPYEVLQNCMTYAYFFDEKHPPTGHPYILTEENYEMLKQRKELFARKFDDNIDSKILDMIDTYIHEGE